MVGATGVRANMAACSGVSALMAVIGRPDDGFAEPEAGGGLAAAAGTDGTAQAGIPTVNTTTTTPSQHVECIGNMLIGLPGGRARAQGPGVG